MEIAVVTVGVAIAGLIIGLFVWLRQDIRRMEERLDNRMGAMENRLSAVEREMAHLRGLTEGLQAAILGRAQEAEQARRKAAV